LFPPSFKQTVIHIQLYDLKPGESVQVTFPCNRPWRPMWLWDVEVPIWWWGCQPYAPAGRPLPPGRFLVLISVRGCVDPRAIVRLKALGQLKNPITLSEIEPATFRLVAHSSYVYCTVLKCFWDTKYRLCMLRYVCIISYESRLYSMFPARSTRDGELLNIPKLRTLEISGAKTTENSMITQTICEFRTMALISSNTGLLLCKYKFPRPQDLQVRRFLCQGTKESEFLPSSRAAM
jgi:hypothetical protein